MHWLNVKWSEWTFLAEAEKLKHQTNQQSSCIGSYVYDLQLKLESASKLNLTFHGAFGPRALTIPLYAPLIHKRGWMMHAAFQIECFCHICIIFILCNRGDNAYNTQINIPGKFDCKTIFEPLSVLLCEKRAKTVWRIVFFQRSIADNKIADNTALTFCVFKFGRTLLLSFLVHLKWSYQLTIHIASSCSFMVTTQQFQQYFRNN